MMNKEKEYVFVGGRMQGKTRDLINQIIKENTNLKQALNEIRDKLLCCGETFDSSIHQQFQKEYLQIIDKALGGYVWSR